MPSHSFCANRSVDPLVNNSIVLMEPFYSISFGHFEVEPLNYPAVPPSLATSTHDQADSWCSDSICNDADEDEAHPISGLQQDASPSSAAGPKDRAEDCNDLESAGDSSNTPHDRQPAIGTIEHQSHSTANSAIISAVKPPYAGPKPAAPIQETPEIDTSQTQKVSETFSTTHTYRANRFKSPYPHLTVETTPHSQPPEIQVHQPPDNIYQPNRTASPPTIDGADVIAPTADASQARQSGREASQSEQPRIRDGSRVRSMQRDFASGELCEVCRTCGHQRFHCNVCKHVYCNPCWEAQFVHEEDRSPPGLPHEKTDPGLARKIGKVLSPQLKEEQIEKIHMDDIDTTWFGVVREGHERPMFQDYGRYATIVAGVKNLRLEATPSLSPTSDGDEALYPSLISFVGQTGAGKSSLIKLLIDLKSEENESFETPVVGAVGRDVATSEDVHLYLDPDSSESQAPLLFADCEGLEGGERDPVAARLKRKMASSQSQNNAASGNRKPTSERELVWADTPKKQSRDFAVAHLYPRLLYTFSDVIVFVLKNPRYGLTGLRCSKHH